MDAADRAGCLVNRGLPNLSTPRAIAARSTQAKLRNNKKDPSLVKSTTGREKTEPSQTLPGVSTSDSGLTGLCKRTPDSTLAKLNTEIAEPHCIELRSKVGRPAQLLSVAGIEGSRRETPAAGADGPGCASARKDIVDSECRFPDVKVARSTLEKLRKNVMTSVYASSMIGIDASKAALLKASKHNPA